MMPEILITAYHLHCRHLPPSEAGRLLLKLCACLVAATSEHFGALVVLVDDLHFCDGGSAACTELTDLCFARYSNRCSSVAVASTLVRCASGSATEHLSRHRGTRDITWRESAPCTQPDNGYTARAVLP
eukprot:15087-Heterococcus_DN1.PRE.1